MGKENGKDFSLGKSLETGAWSREVDKQTREKQGLSQSAIQNMIPKSIRFTHHGFQ